MSRKGQVRLLLAARTGEEAERIVASYPALLKEPALDRLAEVTN